MKLLQVIAGILLAAAIGTWVFGPERVAYGLFAACVFIEIGVLSRAVWTMLFDP